MFWTCKRNGDICSRNRDFARLGQPSGLRDKQTQSQGCGSRSESFTTQWSPELRDYLYPHGSEKYIVVHPATDVWELNQRCGKPGLIRGLFSVRGAQLAAKLVRAARQ